jgi:nucleotide-binding universal stress UspA family protein
MYNRILLPIDLNHKASWSKSLPTALQLCRDYSASLHVVMVIPDFGLPLVGGFFPKEYAAKAKQAITDNLRVRQGERPQGHQGAAHSGGRQGL